MKLTILFFSLLFLSFFNWGCEEKSTAPPSQSDDTNTSFGDDEIEREEDNSEDLNVVTEEQVRKLLEEKFPEYDFDELIPPEEESIIMEIINGDKSLSDIDIVELISDYLFGGDE